MVNLALKEDNMFKGTVSGVGLGDVIQLKSMSGISGALRVKEGKQQGIIYFENGKVIHAICDEFEGEEAFYQIMEFSGGVLDSLNVTNLPSQTIELPVEAMLIEGTRRLDEKNAAAAEKLAGSDNDEVHENDNSGSGDQEETVTLETADDSGEEEKATKEDDMAELKDVLTEFTNIPGVNTACLVGRDGFLLDSIAISGIDTEMIGAIASSGFGASESMGNQLGKGQLSMSMIEYDEGPVMLSPVGGDAFLVVVAEKDANLGMIRLKIKKHTADIVASAAI
jgi:predicted regulator of Ras-like GTPase activity (Roadblock/LC7/MglB family)